MEKFDFRIQPQTKEEEITWLRNALWLIHKEMLQNEKYKNTKLKNEHQWLPLFVGCLNRFEKKMGVTLSSGWFVAMKEYEYFPEAWNSMPFKLKIDKLWGTKLYGGN